MMILNRNQKKNRFINYLTTSNNQPSSRSTRARHAYCVVLAQLLYIFVEFNICVLVSLCVFVILKATNAMQFLSLSERPKHTHTQHTQFKPTYTRLKNPSREHICCVLSVHDFALCPKPSIEPKHTAHMHVLYVYELFQCVCA